MSESISVKGLLQRKYNELQIKLRELKINTDIFEPVNDNADWNYIVSIILSLFPTDDINDIHTNLTDLLLLKSIQITEVQQKAVCEIIRQYISFLHKVRKYLN